MAGEFADSSIGWQLQQSQRRFFEWLEHLSLGESSDGPSEPLPPLPDWLVRSLVVAVLVLSASWLIWVLLRLFLPDLRRWLSRTGTRLRPTVAGAVGDTDLLARPRERSPAAVWLQRAQAWQQQGNYGEACRALYMAMLEHLHETEQVPHKPSRTDGEYRRWARRLPEPQPYQVLLGVHERLCFGEESVSADIWQQCQQAYRTLAEP